MGYLAAFLGTIVAANWAITIWSLVPVGFGLIAPAGVYFAGLAFTLRDLAHDRLGRWPVVSAVVGGAALSWLIAPRFAVASGVAFLVSELADFAVYDPMRRHGWLRAVAVSNVVGLIVDSALFLMLAFGSLAYLPGQILGKAWMTLLAVVILACVRRTNAQPAAS